MSYYPMGFPKNSVKWKGKTFHQIVSSFKKNTVTGKLTIEQLRKPLPLKIYRREIIGVNTCSRASVKIFQFETPGNNIVSEKATGLVNTLDISPTTISAEHGACNTPTACFFSPEYNARKRCRSAGMIPRKFNINKNNDTYCTSTKQYLVARNRTIKQNEYNYIRKGDAGIIPGPGAASNVYSPAGFSHCSKSYISPGNKNNVIRYVWIDKVVYTATIPTGFYDVHELNVAFQTQQFINKTYLEHRITGDRVFLLFITFNNIQNTVSLIANVASQQIYPSATYKEPAGASWGPSGGWGITLNGNYPATTPVITTTGIYGGTYITISQNDNFGELIGYYAGTYFNGLNTTENQGTICSNYVALHYKPNNTAFGVQGAVDSSALIQRKKYNTITDAANGLRSAYGNAAANAMAYGVSEKPYTIKSVVGDKVIYSPVIDKYGKVCKKKYIYRL